MTSRFSNLRYPSEHLRGSIHHLGEYQGQRDPEERVGEPSKIALAKRNVSSRRPFLPGFLFRFNDAFYAGVKTFFAKTSYVSGGRVKEKQKMGRVMIFEMIYSLPMLVGPIFFSFFFLLAMKLRFRLLSISLCVVVDESRRGGIKETIISREIEISWEKFCAILLSSPSRELARWSEMIRFFEKNSAK